MHGLELSYANEVDFTPFVKHIMQARQPHRFKCPLIDLYDGKGDPSYFIVQYRQVMMYYGAPDEILCRVLPSFLSIRVTNYFVRLTS